MFGMIFSCKYQKWFKSHFHTEKIEKEWIKAELNNVESGKEITKI